MAIRSAVGGTCGSCSKDAYMVHECPECLKKVCMTCQPNGPLTACVGCVAKRPKAAARGPMKWHPDVPATPPAKQTVVVQPTCRSCQGHGYLSYREISWPVGYWAILGCPCVPGNDNLKAALAIDPGAANWIDPKNQMQHTIVIKGSVGGYHPFLPGLTRA